MFAVVGLGNPGSRYEATRHNIGFWVVEHFASSCARGKSPLQWQNKFGCSFSRARISGDDCLLVLPQKYMNLSGEACMPLLRYFRVESKDLIVVHDELDLDPGVLRVKIGGSAGGHRGLEDIIEHLSRNDFFRVRVGIGHPRRASVSQGAESAQGENIEAFQGDRPLGEQAVTDWVLGRPGPKEKELLDEIVPTAAKAIQLLIEEGLVAVQRRFHRKQKPKEEELSGSE